MPKFRKTLPVDILLEYANGYLASDYSGGDSVDSVSRRQGIIDLLEVTLNSAGRYCGYSYLDEKAITKSRPGIRWDQEDRFGNTDPTRRRYA